MPTDPYMAMVDSFFAILVLLAMVAGVTYMIGRSANRFAERLTRRREEAIVRAAMRLTQIGMMPTGLARTDEDVLPPHPDDLSSPEELSRRPDDLD